ncbi:His-Xaa-Ser system protein HxsD [bacterium]|nr:His-Xaa-Ser system protein HxsD [bacterium]
MNNYNISKTIFDEKSILKVAYTWRENFDISISEDEYNYILQVKPRHENAIFNWDEFNSQLQEQQLREKLNEQFGCLKQTIYEKAFAHFKG